MKKTRWMLVLAALALAGCDGDDGPTPPPDTFLETLAGTWKTGCMHEPGNDPDYVEESTFSGTSVVFVARSYATFDGTCAGTPTTKTFPTTFVLGGEVAAKIGTAGPSVTARAVDITTEQGVLYTLAYVDTAPDPDVLYLGDERLDPARDGTTAAKRPIVLQDWKWQTRQ